MSKNKPFPPQTITLQGLIGCGIAPTQARLFLPALQAACHIHAINTVGRFAAFLGQCMVESTNFAHLEENLYYTTTARMLQMFPTRINGESMARGLLRNPQALANQVYANRGGNGDAQSGDGWRYRGRGIIQLTLKSNYIEAATANQRPYADRPELVAEPYDAAITAAWYWKRHGCNELADEWHIDAITRAINGPAMAGKLHRRQQCDKVLAALLGED